MNLLKNKLFLGIGKYILKKTVYRPGSIATILRGPLKGYKYIVNDNSGWAYIFNRAQPHATNIYCKFVKPGFIVYDIGANVGIMALLFSKLVGETGKVFVFEALPENAKEIVSTISLNHIENIHIINKAIYSISGVHPFSLNKNVKKNGHLGLPEAEDSETHLVDTVSLDDLISGGLACADLVQIDVLRGEREILDGSGELVNKHHPIFFIHIYSASQDIRVGRFLGKHGYKLYRLAKPRERRRPPLSKIVNRESGWPDPDGVWGSIVAVHPSRDKDIVWDLLLTSNRKRRRL